MVAMDQVEALSRRIAHEFDPDKIILFGSHAYGTPEEHSDVDLLVLMAFEGNAFEQSMEILNRIGPKFAVDLLVRSPDDARRRYEQHDPLIREALDRGKLLYERTG